MYSCKLCAYNPRDHSALREHTQRIHFQCLDCQLSHKNQVAILKHLEEKHGLDFSCGPCQKRYFTKRELKKHNIKVHRRGSSKGQDKRKQHPKELKNNTMKMPDKGKEVLYPCTQCKFQAKNLAYLNIHFNAVHIKKEVETELISSEITIVKREHFDDADLISDSLTKAKEDDLEQDAIKAIKKEVDTDASIEPYELINDVIVETSEFQCSKCDFEGNNTEDLEKHINQRHKVANPFFIASTFVETSALENHTEAFMAEKSKIPNIDVLACDLCNFEADCEKRLKIHKDAVHLKLKNFKCENCDFATGWPKSINAHKKKCRRIKKTEHKRDFTPERDTSEDSYHKRQFAVNKSKIDIFACDLCNFEADCEKRLKIHKDAVHLKLKNFKCENCEFTTGWPRSLNGHKKTCHLPKTQSRILNPNLQHKCDFCDYSSNCSSNVKRHLKSCGPNVNMLTCHKGNCNFTVSNSVALAKHRARCSKDKDSELPTIVNVESGRELACELCDHVAFTNLSLKAHIKVMHKDECRSDQPTNEPIELTEVQETYEPPVKGKWIVLVKKLRFQ